ncbi:MAG: RHS repeat-associated core domain-containing protein [Ginsengibacter sp.]
MSYYPGGMLMPGRKYSIANTNYRYGFNGQENDNEVKGEGNQQDYGMRIYDPRLGRFLSVDPITAKYPELTPYQFASNRPVDGTDRDGLEYISYIPKFNTDGRSVSDYVGAIDNGVIDVLNLVPSLWNSGVATVQSLRRGTYGADFRSDVKQVGSSLKQTAVKVWNEPLKTLTSPDAVEFLASSYFAAKFIPGGGSKGNLLKPVTAAISTAVVEGSFEYYLNIAKTGNFSTLKNSAVFYSGAGQRSLAEKFVASNAGKVTIEGTAAGQVLESANLYKKFTASQADAIWTQASENYTSGVTGEAHAFVKGASLERQYLSTEKPILNSKPDVKLVEHK